MLHQSCIPIEVTDFKEYYNSVVASGQLECHLCSWRDYLDRVKLLDHIVCSHIRGESQRGQAFCLGE